jgi:hypothetical protein
MSTLQSRKSQPEGKRGDPGVLIVHVFCKVINGSSSGNNSKLAIDDGYPVECLVNPQIFLDS